MRIGVNLIAETSISVDDTTYFKTGLRLNGLPVPHSEGSDRWNLNGMLLPGKRVAATGRAAEYNYSDTYTGIGFGGIEARRAVPCQLDLGEGDRLVVTVDNNAVLDPGLFCMDFSFAVSFDDPAPRRALDLSLRRPDIRVDWPARGLFEVDITDALT